MIPIQLNTMSANHLRVEQLANDTRLGQKEKLAEIGRQFEAILLRTYLGDAMKPMLGGGIMSGMNEAQKGIYQDMMVNTLADQISHSGQFGLAHMFQMQLTPKNTAADGPAAASPKE